jgi:hypothetical protein
VLKSDEQQIESLKTAIAQSRIAILQGQQAIEKMESVIRELEPRDNIVELKPGRGNEREQQSA